MASTRCIQFNDNAANTRIRVAAMVLLIAAAAGWAASTRAQGISTGIFDRGNISGTATLGRGEALGNTYTTLGAGVGYMVAEGLLAGISGELWMGEDPKIQKITPEIRYIFTQVERVKPYVGGFFTRTFYDGYDDTNSWGARGGVYFPLGGKVAMNVGLVYEKVMDCDESVYRDCSQVYPEAGILISF